MNRPSEISIGEMCIAESAVRCMIFFRVLNTGCAILRQPKRASERFAEECIAAERECSKRQFSIRAKIPPWNHILYLYIFFFIFFSSVLINNQSTELLTACLPGLPFSRCFSVYQVDTDLLVCSVNRFTDLSDDDRSKGSSSGLSDVVELN